jgi:hypothetical protein
MSRKKRRKGEKKINIVPAAKRDWRRILHRSSKHETNFAKSGPHFTNARAHDIAMKRDARR